MLKRFCLKKSCKQLVDMGEGYCNDHKQEAYAYDQYRGTAAERGYNHKWRKERARYLKLNPLCVECCAVGRIIEATVVDHIIPHKGDKKLFWDKGNWQPLCKKHHDKKTATEDGGFGRVANKPHDVL